MANRQAQLEMFSGSLHASGTWGMESCPTHFSLSQRWRLAHRSGVSMLMEHHARLRMQCLPSIKANWPAPIGVWRVGAGRRLPFTTRCRVFLSTIKSCTQDSPLCLTFLGRSSRVFDGAIRPAYQHCVKTDCVILRLHPSDCPPYYCPSTVGDSSVPVVVYQSEHRVDTERIPYISCSPRVGR